MREIYLIRHGEPEFKDKKSYCVGHIDIPLSVKGIQQALLLKKYLSNKGIENIYSSSLTRCVQTAEIISDKKVIIEEKLQEINVGHWDGLSFEEVKTKYPEEYKARGRDFENYAPPNGESFGACLQRSKESLINILESSKGNIGISSHAGVNRVLLCWIMKKPLSSMFLLPQPYGCINLIQYKESKLEVMQMGKLP